MQAKVRVGKIVGCHGIRGDVKLRPSSDDTHWAASGQVVYLKDGKTGQEQALTIKNTRHQGPLVILNFQQFDNRNQVEPLVGSTLFADMENLTPPEEGEYWVDELIGLGVLDSETGRVRGKVKDVLSSGGNDFLEIQLDESTETVIIPFKDPFFPSVDIANGVVTMDLLSEFLSLSNSPVTADRLEQ